MVPAPCSVPLVPAPKGGMGRSGHGAGTMHSAFGAGTKRGDEKECAWCRHGAGTMPSAFGAGTKRGDEKEWAWCRHHAQCLWCRHQKGRWEGVSVVCRRGGVERVGVERVGVERVGHVDFSARRGKKGARPALGSCSFSRSSSRPLEAGSGCAWRVACVRANFCAAARAKPGCRDSRACPVSKAS